MTVRVCNPSTSDTEVGTTLISSQPGLHRMSKQQNPNYSFFNKDTYTRVCVSYFFISITMSLKIPGKKYLLTVLKCRGESQWFLEVIHRVLGCHTGWFSSCLWMEASTNSFMLSPNWRPLPRCAERNTVKLPSTLAVFSTFLALWPFNTVPRVGVSPQPENHFHWLLHSCNCYCYK